MPCCKECEEREKRAKLILQRMHDERIARKEQRRGARGRVAGDNLSIKLDKAAD